MLEYQAKFCISVVRCYGLSNCNVMLKDLRQLCKIGVYIVFSRVIVVCEENICFYTRCKSIELDACATQIRVQIIRLGNECVRADHVFVPGAFGLGGFVPMLTQVMYSSR